MGEMGVDGLPELLGLNTKSWDHGLRSFMTTVPRAVQNAGGLLAGHQGLCKLQNKCKENHTPHISIKRHNLGP